MAVKPVISFMFTQLETVTVKMRWGWVVGSLGGSPQWGRADLLSQASLVEPEAAEKRSLTCFDIVIIKITRALIYYNVMCIFRYLKCFLNT